jgi:hypothetical protein
VSPASAVPARGRLAELVLRHRRLVALFRLAMLTLATATAPARWAVTGKVPWPSAAWAASRERALAGQGSQPGSVALVDQCAWQSALTWMLSDQIVIVSWSNASRIR